MRRNILVLCVLLPLFVFVLGVSASEEFNYARAYGDYVEALGEYKNVHSEYLLARSQYLQARTLASQTKAQNATMNMLKERDEAVVAYLVALRMRLGEAIGIDERDEEGLNLRIDSEKAWFENHKGRVTSAGTIEDLVIDSNEAADHFEAVTEPLSYEVLSFLALGKVGAMRMEVNDAMSSVKMKLMDVRADGDYDLAIIDRWVLETENKITRSLDKEIEARTLVFGLQALDKNAFGRKDDKVVIYNSVLTKVQESYQFLRESVSFMNEIVRKIKTKK